MDAHRPQYQTSLVQSIWAPETNNNILGYARNPHNQLLSGGSSGGKASHCVNNRFLLTNISGEGAMGALRGSAFGIGVNISHGIVKRWSNNFVIEPSAGAANIVVHIMYSRRVHSGL